MGPVDFAPVNVGIVGLGGGGAPDRIGIAGGGLVESKMVGRNLSAQRVVVVDVKVVQVDMVVILRALQCRSFAS